MPTCRFCNEAAHADWLVRYGTRHYAHPTCYEEAGKSIDELPEYERKQFAEKRRDWLDVQRRHAEKIANHIDGYDRDDLGESPDY